MRKLFYAIVAAAVCSGCMVSCNEKPAHYRFVKVMNDNKEVVEQIDATNDTAAVKLFIDRMTKIVIDNKEPDVKAMYIISPDGDTLNTNEELMEAALQPLSLPAEPVATPAAQ